MPQIYNMGPTAFLSLRRKACWGICRPKHPTASAGFEPANLGTKGQHATPRPPKLMIHSLYRKNDFPFNFIWRKALWTTGYIIYFYHNLLITQGCTQFPKIQDPPQILGTRSMTWSHYYTGDPETWSDAVKSAAAPGDPSRGICARLSLEFCAYCHNWYSLVFWKRMVTNN